MHKKGRTPRDTVDLFVTIKENKRRKRWDARCKMIGCMWQDTAGTEADVSRKWVQHFERVHVAKWDGRR